MSFYSSFILRKEFYEKDFLTMDTLQHLLDMDIGLFIFSFFIIAVALKEFIDLFVYFKKKFGIKTNAETDKEKLESRISSLERHDNWQYKEIVKISEGIEKITDQLYNKEIDDWRYEILNFCTELSNGKNFNRESFDHIKRTHHKYEQLLNSRGMENGLVDESIKYIDDVYRQYLKNDFNNKD
jgi:hypothetical protein